MRDQSIQDVIDRFAELGYTVYEDHTWLIEFNDALIDPNTLPDELRELFYRIEGDGGSPRLKPVGN